MRPHRKRPSTTCSRRELVVKPAVGRAVTPLRLSKPSTDERRRRKRRSFTVGGPPPKSVLNLFDDSRRLFVGGTPRDFRLPATLKQNQFTGDMDKLRINGELFGFWNSERTQGVTGAEMRPLADAERSAESGVSFNGKGYMQMEVGAWNPRKRTAIMFSFMTFSPDGLLFFMGKDRDQLMVELVGGRISLSFDLGSGLGKLLSNGQRYNDGKWHLVQMDRQERSAKLKIDDTDKVEGESPGSMFEMSVSDVFFIGGLPSNIDARFTVHPFHGCMRNLKLDDEYVELARARVTKGVQLGCANREVRIGTLLSERAYAQFTGLKLSSNNQLQLSFRFRPAAYVPDRIVHLLTVFANNDQEEIVRVLIENGTTLVIKPNGAEGTDSAGAVRAELGQQLASGWHHVALHRDAQTLRAMVDDTHEETLAAPIEDASDLLDSSEIVLAFGRLESSALSSAHSIGFVGCLGDLLFGAQQLLSLASSSSNELTLSGCTMGPPKALSAGKAPPKNEVDELKKAEDLEGQKIEEKSTQKPSVPQIPSSQIRPEGACALPLQPHGEREDSAGMRFGLTPNARVEFALPDTLHESAASDFTLELQLRATAANGVIGFATDERHQDFTALYMSEGRPAFAFGDIQAKMNIQSTRSVLDDEWHTLRVEREAGAAVLYLDGRLEAQNRTNLGTIELLQLQSPLYIGGLPPELVPLAARLLPGVKPEFGGCLREFALNDLALEEPVAEKDIAQCSQFTEQGIFFGKDGGYAILSPQFVVGLSFSFELELKPRTKTAVLLSVGVLEFLSLQLLNGTVKFAVDNGAGMESVIYEPISPNSLCDGHWHQIKIIKKKNLITLNVDGKSNLHIMKKKSTGETSTKDPLYLGGVPKDTKLRGLDTAEPFVGCMRILGIGKKQRRRRNLADKAMEELTADELTERMNLFGSVSRSACPLN
ncbi:hypothetical protein niasHT_036523 [Heterodera trifolii]|uniref:Laminin G domain-containing protein n=1 Tax=Heterodera trifolii TaxID=157864 RepID=A0ABD2IN73_9BILA